MRVALCTPSDGSAPLVRPGASKSLINTSRDRRTIMSAFLRTAAITVTALASIGVAQAQVTCQNAQYAPEVLAKYPNIRTACLDIVTRDGEPYAVVKGELDRVYSNNSVGVRIKRSDGTYSQRQTLKTERDLRVMI